MNRKESDTDGHEHVLTLTNKEAYDVDCAVCSQRCSGFTFNCILCSLHAHKQCLGKPNKFKSPYHPHVLTLEHYKAATRCDACYAKIDGFLCRCRECHMHFHTECAFLIKADNEDQIQYPIHLHPLSCGSEGGDDIETPSCKACDKPCLGKAYYHCSPCKFFLHISCAKLPKELTISFQRNPISICLATQPNQFTCCVCGDERHGFSYKGKEELVVLVMDVECASSIHQSQAQSSNLEDFFFTFHRHPLIFHEKIENGMELICKACDKEICEGPAYGCNSCKYFLHTSCTESKQISRPYHTHPLKLVYQWPHKVKCKLCRKDCNGAFYACVKGCYFMVDFKCSSTMSIIQFHGHRHPLVFCDEVSKKVKCSLCRTKTNLSVFLCLECRKYHLELLCGPIPCNIKSRHMHALELCDSYVEDDTGEDSCDVCEKRRDPREAVYLCRHCEDRGCPYLAEINCVMPEVLRAIRGDLGVVELRTVRTRIPGKVILGAGHQQEDDHEEVTTDALTQAEEADDATDNVNQLWDSMTKDEKKKLEALWEDMKKFLSGRKYEKPSDEMQCSDKEFNLLMESLEYCNVAEIFGPFKQFRSSTQLFAYKERQRLLSSRSSPFEWLLMTVNVSKLINVTGGHKIPHAFESIYTNLVDNYGDVSEDCKISPAGKSISFALFLLIIAYMRRRQLFRVRESDLRVCHFYLKYLHLVGFKIQFAFKNLKKLARAYFGLQIVMFERRRLEYLNQQVARHSKAIEEQEAKLLVVQMKQMEHMRHMRTKKSSLMEKCLSEARALKYKVGWKLLL